MVICPAMRSGITTMADKAVKLSPEKQLSSLIIYRYSPKLQQDKSQRHQAPMHLDKGRVFCLSG